jgi:phage terminase large subunit-like protein
MPWQQQVADVALEFDPATGIPFYREVWWSVMRQSGKTSLALPYQLDRCISADWGPRQRVVYTAQTGKDATKKLLDDQIPIIEQSPLRRLITPAGGGKVRRGAGDVGVNFGTGGKIDLLGSTEASGHGSTIHLGVIDEAWKDQDDRREQALQPAMLTIPSAQLLGFSTMGTDSSVYLNRKVEVGRAAAMENSGAGIAYFEYSVPEDEDVDDPDVWWRYMPALGYTITEETIRHARQSMTEGDFRRAVCNQRTTSSERVFPADVWDAVQDPRAEPSGDLSYGVDVIRGIDGKEDSAAIGVFGERKLAVLEHRPGTTWVVDRMAELHRSKPGRIVVDGGGPAASVADDLEDLGLPVFRVQYGGVASACARLYDAVADRKVRVYPSQPLDMSVSGLAKKPVGDRFVWSRAGSSSDATPMMAVTLAHSRGEQEVTPWIDFA